MRTAAKAVLAGALYCGSIYCVGILTMPVTTPPTPDPPAPTVLVSCAQAGCPTPPDAMNGRLVTMHCPSAHRCTLTY